MADRVVMRFSPEAMALFEKILDHAKECPTCGLLASRAKEHQEPVVEIGRMGCLTGVLLFQEWGAEYERLHTEPEKRRHDRMTPDEVDALVAGCRGIGRHRA